MSELENHMMQNRVQLAQIWNMLAKNMVLAKSESVPAITSTFSLPTGFTSSTMFSQIQGITANILGDDVGSLMSMLATPGIQSLLPDFIAQPINTMLSSAPIGGSADPGGFMYSQLYRNLGRNIPRVSLPGSFDNRYAIDLYNEQQRALEEYAGRFNLAQIDAASPLEQLPIANANNPQDNISKVIGFRNVLALRGREKAFDNAFSLFNEMNIFGPRMDDDFLESPEFAALQKAKTEAEALSVLDSKVKIAGSDVEVRKIVESAMDRGSQASGLISGAQMLSSFMGGNAAQNAEINSLGDLLSEVFQLNENKNAFLLRGSQALGAVGNLGIHSVSMAGGRKELIANRLTASIMDRINASGPNANTQEFNPYRSLQQLGFGRSAELLTELSRGGMLSTGGVDIYGNIGVEEVKRMESSIMVQLEGFSEITKAAKRMGLKTQEVVQNLQGMYGGRATDALDQAASRAMDRLTAIGKDGMSLADTIIAAEERRRTEVLRRTDSAAPAVNMGAEERSRFLQIEAQRRGGADIMQQLGQAVELGRMAGIDTRGVFATATTANQILQTLGMGGAGSLSLTAEALSMVATSRNRAGSPITTGEALAFAGMKVQRALQNPNARAVAVLNDNIARGILKADDPKVKELLDKASRGEDVDPSAVMNVLQTEGVSAEVAFSDTSVMGAMDRQAAAVSDYTDMSKATGVVGAVEEVASRVIGGSAGLNTFTQAAAQAFKLAPNSELISVAANLIEKSETDVNAQLDAAVDERTLSKEQANQLRQLRGQLLDSNLQGLPRGTSANMTRALIARANQRTQTGLSGSELAAAIKTSITEDLATAFAESLTGAQGAFRTGINDVRTQLIKAKAQQLADSDPDKYAFTAPNKDALERATKELMQDPGFVGLDETEKDKRIKKLAKEFVEEDKTKYGERKPTEAALQEARKNAQSRIAAKNIPENVDYDTLVAQELQKLTEKDPDKYSPYSNAPNEAALDQAAEETSQAGFTFRDILTALSGQNSGMPRVLEQELAKAKRELEALKNPQNKEESRHKAILEGKIAAYEDLLNVAQAPDPSRHIEELQQKMAIVEQEKQEKQTTSAKTVVEDREQKTNGINEVGQGTTAISSSADKTQADSQAQADASGEKSQSREKASISIVGLDQSATEAITSIRTTANSLLDELKDFRTTIQTKLG